MLEGNAPVFLPCPFAAGCTSWEAGDILCLPAIYPSKDSLDMGRSLGRSGLITLKKRCDFFPVYHDMNCDIEKGNRSLHPFRSSMTIPLLSIFVSTATFRPRSAMAFSTAFRSFSVIIAMVGPTEDIPTKSKPASRILAMYW